VCSVINKSNITFSNNENNKKFYWSIISFIIGIIVGAITIYYQSFTNSYEKILCDLQEIDNANDAEKVKEIQVKTDRGGENVFLKNIKSGIRVPGSVFVKSINDINHKNQSRHYINTYLQLKSFSYHIMPGLNTCYKIADFGNGLSNRHRVVTILPSPKISLRSLQIDIIYNQQGAVEAILSTGYGMQKIQTVSVGEDECAVFSNLSSNDGITSIKVELMANPNYDIYTEQNIASTDSKYLNSDYYVAVRITYQKYEGSTEVSQKIIEDIIYNKNTGEVIRYSSKGGFFSLSTLSDGTWKKTELKTGQVALVNVNSNFDMLKKIIPNQKVLFNSIQILQENTGTKGINSKNLQQMIELIIESK